jgi:hypothetical protein
MRKQAVAALVVGLVLVGAGVSGGGAAARPRWGGAPADVVLEWNEILQRTIPANASLAAPRYYSMLHIAMFDAANSIERRFGKYLVQTAHGHGGSAEIAAAAAARDVLAELIPTARADYDRALASRVARAPGRSQSSLWIGRAVARKVLEWRANDGWEIPPPPFVLPPFPGLWQPAPGAAAFTQYPNVRPFALLTGTLYLPPPPPTLTSERYARDFNEVKRLGSVASAERTPDQTQAAHLFAAIGTRTNLYMLWNNVARDLIQDRGLALVDAARLFVLLNVGTIDGVQTTMASKYIYGMWRPVTAIRRAGEDLNPGTDPEPDWTPLLNTPPYPTYAGNQACVASAAARALEIVAGDDEVPVTAVWEAPDGSVVATRTYEGFRQMADEQARSRVYGGIHFTFDNEVSQEICPRVVDFVARHYMVPR